jgi:hypothetical protein
MDTINSSNYPVVCMTCYFVSNPVCLNVMTDTLRSPYPYFIGSSK